jgi:membrane peptidoglycan carboxypeptidase
MQAGSTFKVFGLLAALQKDISTKKRYNGYGPRYLPEFATAKNPRGAVRNFAGESLGRMDLRKALAESVNTIFAQLNVDIAKPGRSGSGVRDAAILAAVPKSTSGLDTTIGNILGSASPHVKDMANAFATIAAEGKRATPYLISRVTFASGRDDYVAEKNLSSAFDKDVTTDVTEAMTHVVTEGTATGAKALGRPAAGKTGTATENKAVWFDGFTPQLAAAVGIYQGNGQEKITVKGITEVTGGSFPVDIWTAFMKGALDGEKVLAFPKRVGLGDSALPPPPVPTTQAPQSPTTPAPTRAPRSEAPTQAPPTSPPASGPETAPPPDNVPPGGPPNTAVPTGAPATAPVKRPGRRKPPKPAPTVALATP